MKKTQRCGYFPIILDIELSEQGIDLGNIELVKFAKISFQGFVNEVGTTIPTIRYRYTDTQLGDVSLQDDPNTRSTLNSNWESPVAYTNDGLVTIKGGSLPPGTYTIEVKDYAEKFESKTITFEVTNKDVDLGKIILKKK